MSGWRLTYDDYNPAQEGRREALCALGNGVFVTRAAAADSGADHIHYPGCYLAGGYNRLTTEIDGRVMENEDLVNLPNWLPLTFRIEDGEWFRIDAVEILAYHQALDLKTGLLLREIRFRDVAGRTTRWNERRFVSMAAPHIAGLAVELTAEDWAGRLAIRTALDASVTNSNVRRYRALANRHLEMLELNQLGTDALFLRVRTNQSLIHIAQAARTRLYRGESEIDGERRTELLKDIVRQEITCEVERDQAVIVEKIAALHTSLDNAISEPGLAARQSLFETGRLDELAHANALVWQQLWEECDIVLEEHESPGTALKLRLHMFHVLQTVSAHTADRDVGVPARGWHGEGYRGHIFWDELYVFPFLNLRIPVLTRALLLYRYRRLDWARRAARQVGHRGAMFPWQSGSDGREETPVAYFNPLSGRWIPDHSYRQRHIGSAIAYNIWQYFQATDDREFLYSYGAEMMFEIARFWASLVTYNPAINRYEINGVMGPDEYHTAYPGADPETHGGLRNSAYTNVMASWVLSRACDILDVVPAIQCRRICERIGLGGQEIEHWREISMKLRVPLQGGGIISQFDGYDRLMEFDWAAYEKKYGNIGRLDFILEAEGDTPNGYKLSKQADVPMLFYLFSADELGMLFEQLGYPFERDTIPKNVEYYLARTSHGSTLSRVAHSWVLARSDRRRSWELFLRALDSDIEDIQGGTTQEGIHIGAMAGVIDIVQRCYLGIEMRSNVLHFDPALPAGLTCVKVRLRYRRQILEVEVNCDRLRIASRPFTANPITIAYRGHFRDLAPGDSYEFRLLKSEERNRDENRIVRASPNFQPTQKQLPR
jgi:trehalose/maltose hydrolase-like predicted phosphorylase